MRIAYLDCFSGISGDMFLGALVDAGVPFDLLQKTVAELNIGATLEVARVDRGGISATKLDVVVGGEKDMPREEFWARRHSQEEAHSAAHPHDHGRSHDAGHDAAQEHTHEPSHGDGATHSHEHQHERGLSEILEIIAAAPLSERARRTASEIFVALGTAEAKVHNVDLEHIHFHEVGAADAIVDIVCAAVGAEALGVERFVASPLNVGGGTVACAHGVMPVPAPATLELLKGIPIYSGEIRKELVTPTGAAIARILVTSFEPRPAMTTDTIGYGAGARNFPGHANLLRLSIGDVVDAELTAAEFEAGGDAVSQAAVQEEISILEANLDDLNPQLIGYIAELALADGALDVFTAAVQMKKSRPGTLLTVLAKPEDEAKLRALIFRESSTLGIRVRCEKRYALPRRFESVATPWGAVQMKVAAVNGTVSQYAPEYEDCRRIAAEHHLPLKTVMQEAIRRYLDQKNG